MDHPITSYHKSMQAQSDARVDKINNQIAKLSLERDYAQMQARLHTLELKKTPSEQARGHMQPCEHLTIPPDAHKYEHNCHLLVGVGVMPNVIFKGDPTSMRGLTQWLQDHACSYHSNGFSVDTVAPPQTHAMAWDRKYLYIWTPLA